jgi:hypothetical protein
MLCPFPQQAGKESGLKRCLEVYLFIGDDLVDQKEHPKREEKGKDIFKRESNDGSQFQGRFKIKTIALEVSHHRREGHTCQMQTPHEEHHKKVNCDSPNDPMAFFNLKDNVEGRPQGTKHKNGGPY